MWKSEAGRCNANLGVSGDSGVTRGLIQVGQSLAQGGPLVKTQKNVKKW